MTKAIFLSPDSTEAPQTIDIHRSSSSDDILQGLKTTPSLSELFSSPSPSLVSACPPFCSILNPAEFTLVLHLEDTTLPENPRVSELLRPNLTSSSPAAIHGPAIVLYAEADTHFTAVDLEAFTDAIYGFHLKGGERDREKVAKAFYESRDKIRSFKETRQDEEGDSDWEDEMEQPENDDDEEELDSEAEYETDEESEEEMDPQKLAAIDKIIKGMLKEDGKLDLERLGLKEVNGKLVPKRECSQPMASSILPLQSIPTSTKQLQV